MLNADELFIQADSFWEKGKLRPALLTFQKSAELGSGPACNNVGFFYDRGLGVRRNLPEALRWYKKAVKKGEAAAATNIGTIYRDNGNTALARKWFNRGLAMGDGDAALELAKTYISITSSRNRISPQARKFLQIAIASKSIVEENREAAAMLLSAMAL